MHYDNYNHKEYEVQKLVKPVSWNNLVQSKSFKIGLGLILWSLLLVIVSFQFGASHEKASLAAKNKPLPAPKSVNDSQSVNLAKASQFGKDKQFDQVISLLLPEVEDSSKNADQRAAGKVLIAQAYFAKADLDNALKWYTEANSTAGIRLDATIGVANVSSQLYAKTYATDRAKAETYKTTAISAFNEAISLTSDQNFKSQLNKQLDSLQKAK